MRTVAPSLLMPSPYPSARVAVDGDSWQAFRQAALVRGIHVSDYLAKLVQAELARRAPTSASEVSLAASEADQGLACLRALAASLWDVDVIFVATVGALAAAMVGWTEAKRFEELATSYAAAGRELVEIRTVLTAAQDDESFEEFPPRRNWTKTFFSRKLCPKDGIIGGGNDSVGISRSSRLVVGIEPDDLTGLAIDGIDAL